MKPDEAVLLVKILAHCDAVWLPMRAADWIQPVPAVLYERRREFPMRGIRWRSDDSTAAGRKADERALSALCRDGFVVQHGSAKDKSIELSKLAEHRARALAGMPSLVVAHGMLRKVISLGSKMARELWLIGLRQYPADGKLGADLVRLENQVLPALSCGWLEAHSDSGGGIWYLATEIGRAAAKRAAPVLPQDLPDSEESLMKIYDSNVDKIRNALRASVPDSPQEIGPCPLPHSIDLQPSKKLTRPRKKQTV